MKRALLILTIWLAFLAPAYAVITQVVGSGVGNNVGSNNGSTGTLVITLNAAVPANSLLDVGLSVRSNSVGVTGCVDSSGSNSYTVVTKNGSANSDGAQAYSFTTAPLSIGSTVSCSISSSLAVTGIASAWSGVAAVTPVDPASPTPISATSNTYNAGTSGTLATSGDLAIGSIAFGSASTVTEAGGYTSLGTNLTSNGIHVGAQILTSNAPNSYAPVGTASQVYSGILLFFVPAAGGGTPVCKRGLLGVGC